MNRRQHLTGVALTLFSAVVFSTAGLFTKGISADPWAIIFWRGLFATLFTAAYVGVRRRWTAEILQMRWPGWTIAIVGAAGSAAFIPAFKLTTMANVALIYAAAPFIAAALAWLWLREVPSKLTLATSLAAIGGVLIIVYGSVSGVNLRGDLLALWMTIAMATLITLYRRYPNTPAAGPAALSSLLLLPPALVFGEPLAAPVHEIPIMAGFGLIFALASVTLLEGAKRLSAPETALLSALEAPLAPLWAWAMFHELPPMTTFLGGAIILIAVVVSQLPVLWNQRRRPWRQSLRSAPAGRASKMAKCG